ncbi:uncharacterized protein LOC128557892 [Mercenaria mercenaria]|uniref:uncharacterized protein LOC128557892 n=1 Tax=Mercenaria mercenaria TaxID=6596 RepID=UPI00234F22E4|nr:uncharacterized protein LOC128557892 [Mercenaria mercenaria]
MMYQACAVHIRLMFVDPNVTHTRHKKEDMWEKIVYTCMIPNKTFYPRYHNTKRRLKDLQQRFADFDATLRCSSGTALQESFGGDVRFIILSRKPTKSIETVSNSISKALFPNEDAKQNFIMGISLQNVLREIKTEAIVFVPSRMSEFLHSNISKNRDVQFIIVTNDLKERKQHIYLFEGYSNVKVSLVEDVKETASVALEEIIFKPVKHTTETLVNLLKFNGRQNIHEDQKKKRSEPKSCIGTNTCRMRLARKRLSGKLEKEKRKRKTARKMTKSTHLKTSVTAHGKTKNRGARNRRKELLVSLDCVKRSKQVEPKEYITRSKLKASNTKVFEEKIQKHRDSLERLLGEILGMYDRSKVPENERPVTNESLEQNVSDEVADKLYAIDASVKSCGYRFETLQVFVDDTCNDEIKNKVRDVLRKNKIMNYDIVPSIGSFKPLYKVGAKVQPNQDRKSYGTVGGFAKKNQKGLVALVSRHVAIHSSDSSVLLRNEHMKIRAKIIPETLPPQDSHDNILDISAVEIQPTDKEKCDTRFKTEDGDLTSGKESSYETRQLRSRHVHLWGGTTSPGLGIVTMPNIRDRDRDNTFIIVEDRQNADESFCKEGDSGSMVCADDIDGEGVEVISMLIGEDNDHRGKYATFRIDKGLDQLKRQTKDDFQLCKD